MITLQELSEIKERCEKAPPGPWTYFPDPGNSYPGGNDPYGDEVFIATHAGDCDLTAKFIAHCREDIPKLLSEVEKLREQLEYERLRLAGCGVTAMQNTRQTIKDRITPDNPHWSASYGDVCRAVDAEVDLREKLEKCKTALEKIADSPEITSDGIKYDARQALKGVFGE